MESPELSLAVLFAIAAGLLVAGIVIGLLIGRRQSPASQKYREVERKLDQVLQDKKVYEEVEQLDEKLKVSDGVGAWIKDFQDSDAPQFKGKSKDERKKMALAAYLEAKGKPKKKKE